MRRHLAVALLALSLGLSACSSDEEPAAERDDTAASASQEPAPSEEPPATEETVGALEVEVGDCVVAPTDDQAAEGVEELQAVPCTETHDGEVYATFDLPDGEFPGDAEVSAAGEGRCTEDFATYVGKTFEESRLDVSTLYPSEETWADGDREYVCIAVDPEGSLTASVKGSAQ